MAGRASVLASGAVVWRRHEGHTQLLVIHRPRYDDWTFPKGKTDPGELLAHTATREVFEETGVRVRLGRPLHSQCYRVRGDAGTVKRVEYWAARPVDRHDVAAYRPNDEVDEVRWVGLHDVCALLTYDRDREVVEAFRAHERGSEHRTRTLVVLRHAAALPRDEWSGPDARRGLLAEGRAQAERLVPSLAAYGVRRIVSSDADRCVETVAPYADRIGAEVVLDLRLAEHRARPQQVRRATYDRLDERRPVVVVSHRPVLPYVTDALGLEDDDPLATAELLVIHHRHGAVVATERLVH